MNLSQTCHVIPEEKEEEKEEEEEISHISMVGLEWISLLLECEDRSVITIGGKRDRR